MKISDVNTPNDIENYIESILDDVYYGKLTIEDATVNIVELVAHVSKSAIKETDNTNGINVEQKPFVPIIFMNDEDAKAINDNFEKLKKDKKLK